MKIGIIGAGLVGRSLGWRLTEIGHDVIFGVRHPETVELRQNQHAISMNAAIAEAEIVVLALPWRVVRETVPQLEGLEGKTIIDLTNPVSMGPNGLELELGFDTSAGEIIQSILPEAHVVKTLNQCGAETMRAPQALSEKPVLFSASNHHDAKETVMGLLTDMGFDALDAGDITKSRILEPMAMVFINQAINLGGSRNWAFARAFNKEMK